MSLVAVYVRDPVLLQRLRAALGASHELAVCEDWQALTGACESMLVHAAVIDFCTTGRAAFEELRLMRSRFPRIAIVGYVAMPPALPRDLFDAGRLGLAGMVVAEVEDAPAQLLEAVEQAETRGMASIIAAGLEGVPARIRNAFLLTVTRASTRLTPLGLSRILGVSRRRLAQQLAQHGFPPPQRLITWGRLIVAAHLLETTRSTADGVAAALRFPSGSAFRNTCQRYLHATPGMIRARGGAGYVYQALLGQTAAPNTNAPAEDPDALHRHLQYATDSAS